MQPPEKKTPEERFEEAWREWTRRPPRQAPAEAAARVGSLIREGQRRRQPRWAIAAAAAVLFAAIAVAVHWTRLSYQPGLPQPVPAVREAPQLGGGEVLMWIDKDTPLYMTFQPPDEGQAKGGKL